MNDLGKGALIIGILCFANVLSFAATPGLSTRRLPTVKQVNDFGISTALTRPSLRLQEKLSDDLAIGNRMIKRPPTFTSTITRRQLFSTPIGWGNYGLQQLLEYTLKPAPRADSEVIEAHFVNIKKLPLTKRNHLLLDAAYRKAVDQSPMTYREFEGVKKGMGRQLSIENQTRRPSTNRRIS